MSIARHRAASTFALWLLVGSAASADIVSGRYELAADSSVHMCGGLAYQCYDSSIWGDLWLSVDPLAGTARIDRAELWMPIPGSTWSQAFPSEDDLQLEELEGELVDPDTVRLVSAEEPQQTVEWTLTATGSGLALDGFYDEGCCDRFIYTFDAVELNPVLDSVPGDTVLRLHRGRFEVSVSWQTADASGQGRVVEVEDGVAAAATDSGLLWFFSEDNWELLVKVLDGCELNGHFWVFSTAATDARYLVEVLDAQTGERWSHFSQLGEISLPVTDTEAFDTCP